MSEQAQPFLDMAERIKKIDPAEFAGAVVVVPPKGQGEVVAFLLSDPKPDGMHFWTDAKTRTEVGAGKFMEEAAAQDPFGRRR